MHGLRPIQDLLVAVIKLCGLPTISKERPNLHPTVGVEHDWPQAAGGAGRQAEDDRRRSDIIISMSTHEDFTRELHSSGPSDRSFGVVFTVLFLVLGVLPLRHGKPVRIWCEVLAGVILLVTLIRPRLLHHFNVIWMRCGKLLGKIVNPIVTALLFYLVFTPAAVILRWMGKDLLGLAFDAQAATYWRPRGESGPESSMVDQF
jgi:hypothetical protein